MKFVNVFCLALAMAVLTEAGRCAEPLRKPSDVPVRYRDFKVYTTSAPDPKDASHIIMTLQLHNEGSRALKTKVRLNANPKAGFKGGETSLMLNPKSERKWSLALQPPDGLRYE